MSASRTTHSIAIVGSGLYSKCAILIFAIQMAAIVYGIVALFFHEAPYHWEGLDPLGNSANFTSVPPPPPPRISWDDCELGADRLTQVSVRACVGAGGGVSVWWWGGRYLGPSLETLQANLWPNYSPGLGYSSIFKVVFPAVTGIMAGANMSGASNASPSSRVE